MKRPLFRMILLFALFAMLLGACAPAATPTLEPTSVKETVTVKETVQVKETVIVPQVITATPRPQLRCPKKPSKSP